MASHVFLQFRTLVYELALRCNMQVRTPRFFGGDQRAETAHPDTRPGSIENPKPRGAATSLGRGAVAPRETGASCMSVRLSVCVCVYCKHTEWGCRNPHSKNK